MRLLLDTNTLLWWLEDPDQLGSQAHSALKDPSNSVFCSSISAVEIAIKLSTGKLTLQADWETAAKDAQFLLMPFTHDHARCFRTLPLLHKDPFDRMIVAQTMSERATLITADRKLAEYGIPILSA
jgi:PIN domain nuclease of toxin-antitoxin system